MGRGRGLARYWLPLLRERAGVRVRMIKFSGDAHRAIQYAKAVVGAVPSPQPSPSGEGARRLDRRPVCCGAVPSPQPSPSGEGARRLHRRPVCCGAVPSPQPSPSGEGARTLHRRPVCCGAVPSPQPSPSGERARTLHRPPVGCGRADGLPGRCQKNPSVSRSPAGWSQRHQPATPSGGFLHPSSFRAGGASGRISRFDPRDQPGQKPNRNDRGGEQ